jgi:murein DD-endopeptidase MepM/ murein hydrolase activator NlpD
MPKFRDPKVLLWPLLALMICSAFALRPSSASAVTQTTQGFQIVSTPLATSKPNVTAPNWVLPMQPIFDVIHEFSRPTSDWGAGHRGIDFAAPTGSSLLAPHSGTISLAGLVFAVPTIVLSHPEGTSSVFQPVCLDDALKVGDQVSVGQSFGHYCALQNSELHCGALPCVHWAFRLDRGVYLNPLRMVGLIRPSSVLMLGKTDEVIS